MGSGWSVWCCSDRVPAAMHARIPITTSPVFLHGMTDRWAEFDRLAHIETNIIDDTGAVVRALPYRAGAYRDRTSLMREIRREGVDL